MKAGDLAELFKLKQTALLVFTGAATYLAFAPRPDAYTLSLLLASMLLSVAGTTGFNMVLDADIDAAMFRTRSRPLPSRRMTRGEALAVSAAALVAGTALGLLVNIYVALAGILGFILDIAAYTLLLKRRTPLSTVVGGFAGGMPALGGWAAATGSIGLGGVTLMLVVAAWSSLHIWTLAAYYADDYRRAGVPMLPVVAGEKATVAAVLAVIAVVASLSVAAYLQGLVGPVGLAASLAALAVAAIHVASSLSGEYRRRMFAAFKAANAYMGLFFLSLLVHRLVKL